MSDVIIRARDLTKVYRLYAGPGYRFLDMFGMLGQRPGAYTEHSALAGISLEIHRGEKVAFIGRNGAGKSTLLKLITKVIEPSSGTLTVMGKAHALLQIGTGFHPDFTGRQNVFAYLAQLGVVGREAERKYVDIVEFAELEEYIDQPVKTYSSGMGVRLMFSTATAITPELLILDEVLSVGDAYFAHKSYDRIRQLCAAEQTTLLLVTHDVYSAARVCERMIWLDGGQVLLDADPDTVVTAYEQSVRIQEERRLRKKKMSASPAAPGQTLLFELSTRDGRPLSAPVYIHGVSLSMEGTTVDSLPIAGAVPHTSTATLFVDSDAWGERLEWQGRPARAMRSFGSVFHKVSGRFDVSQLFAADQPGHFEIVVDYWAEAEEHVVVEAFLGDRRLELGEFVLVPGSWQTLRAKRHASTRVMPAAEAKSQFGSGRVRITDVKAVSEGRVGFIFDHGQPFTIEIHYVVNDPELHDPIQALASFQRDGVQDVCRLFCRELTLAPGAGIIRIDLAKLPLAEGTYAISIGLTEQTYFDSGQALFYAINPGMYDCQVRALEIQVVKGGVVGNGTGVVIDAEWHVMSGPLAAVEH